MATTIKTYTTTKIDEKLSGKANSTHTHTSAQITDLSGKLAAKQDKLVSGTNIKTVNGNSLLGSGNILLETDAKNLGVITQTGQALETYLLKFLEADEKAILAFVSEGYLYPSVGSGPGMGSYLAFLTGDSVLTILGENGKMYTLDNGFTELNYSKSEIDASHASITNKITTAQNKANSAYELAEQAKHLASGIDRSYSFPTQQAMESALQVAPNEGLGSFKVGDTLYIKESGVPDYWISAVFNTSEAGKGNRWGYYEIRALEVYTEGLQPKAITVINPATEKPVSTTVEDTLQTFVDHKHTADNEAALVGSFAGTSSNSVKLESAFKRKTVYFNTVCGKKIVVEGNTPGSNIALNKSDIGLPNVNNTSDLDKPISTATQNALNNKADKTSLQLKQDKVSVNLSEGTIEFIY